MSAENLGALIVEQIREGMVYDDAWNELEDGFEYWIGGHKQVVTWEGPFEQSAMEGWMVTVKTDFLREKQIARKGNVSSLGRLASALSFCGLVKAEKEGDWQLASSVLVHSGISSWIQRPIFQACTHQFIHCFDFLKPMPELKNHFNALTSSAGKGSDASLKSSLTEQTMQLIGREEDDGKELIAYEFNQLISSFQAPPCVLCNGDESGMTAEFPFESQTQLLTVKEKYHQRFGKGLEILLRLPFEAEPEQLSKLAFELNENELEEISPSYFLGSWFFDESVGPTLAFLHFIPFAYLQPNILTNYVNQFRTRAEWVDQVLNEADWHESYMDAQQEKLDALNRSSKTFREEPEKLQEINEALNRDTDPADSTFRKLADFVGALEEPTVVEQVFYESVSHHSLFHYGIFNPYGPTWCMVTLAKHEKHDHYLLCHAMLNPFKQTFQVLGTGTEESLSGVEGMEEILVDAFRINGACDEPLLRSFPSWVVVPEEDSSKPVFNSFVAYANQFGVIDLNSTVQNLREFEGNPWDRATAQMQEGMERAMGKEPKKSFLGKILGKQKKITDATINDWWLLASDEDHLKSEITNMIPAWKGAIDVQRKNGEVSFPELMEFEGLIKILYLSGLADEIMNRFVKGNG